MTGICYGTLRPYSIFTKIWWSWKELNPHQILEITASNEFQNLALALSYSPLKRSSMQSIWQKRERLLPKLIAAVAQNQKYDQAGQRENGSQRNLKFQINYRDVFPDNH
jgi:hypothetical protein